MRHASPPGLPVARASRQTPDMAAVHPRPDTRIAVRFVVATIFIDAIGFGIVMPVVPALVMALEHGTLAQATRTGGWLAMIYALMQFLLGPLAGGLGDRFGRRPVLIGALGGFAIDYLLMGFSPGIGWLFVGRALAGVFGASYGPATAALADVSTPDDRARTFGLISAAFGIGFVVGPAIGGLLGTLGPRAPFYAAAALAACNFTYGLLFFPETLPRTKRRALDAGRLNPLGALLAIRRAGRVLPLLAIYFFWQMATLVYPVTWAYYAIASFGWSTAMIGASLAWSGIVMATVQMLFVGRIVARLGERQTAALGIAAATLGFLGYAFVRDGTLVFVLLTLTGLQSVVQPSIMAMMSRRVAEDQQGELQGLNGSVAALAAILAPLVLTQPLAYFTGPHAPFFFPGAAFVISATATATGLLVLLATPRAEPV
jgi:DHA1 family tetracycline resistance protein-like MFS transporter